MVVRHVGAGAPRGRQRHLSRPHFKNEAAGRLALESAQPLGPPTPTLRRAAAARSHRAALPATPARPARARSLHTASSEQAFPPRCGPSTGSLPVRVLSCAALGCVRLPAAAGASAKAASACRARVHPILPPVSHFFIAPFHRRPPHSAAHLPGFCHCSATNPPRSTILFCRRSAIILPLFCSCRPFLPRSAVRLPLYQPLTSSSAVILPRLYPFLPGVCLNDVIICRYSAASLPISARRLPR